MKIQSSCEESKNEFKENPKEDDSMKTVSENSIGSIFKERLINYRRTLSKKMVIAEQLDMRNPQMVSEFAYDIYNNMK